MADRRLSTSIPIWVRVSGIIALVLVGVVVSSMLLGSSSGDHGSGGQMGGMDDMGSSGSDGHGSSGQMGGMDQDGDPTAQAAPSESEPAESAAPSTEGGPSHGPGDPTPPDGSGGH